MTFYCPICGEADIKKGEEMIELFDRAHVLAREINDLHAVGAKIPKDKTKTLRQLMDILKGYAVLRTPK